MEEFMKVPSDLYVSNEDFKKMEKGQNGTGCISVPESEKANYILVSQYAFQPITKKDIIDDNTFDVVFILD